MHRSRPFVLVVLAAAAACSKHDPSNDGTDPLSQDRSLVARLETSNKDARRPSVPDACGPVAVAATPSAADQQRADELTQQAGVAEMHGDIQDARTLLLRAATLDGTNKSTAYHLGRTSEALGDRASALTAYCRYLALAPTAAESAEARQRVAALARPLPRATAGTSGSNVAPRRSFAPSTPRPARHTSPITRSRIAASSPVPDPEPATSPASAPPSTEIGHTAAGDVVAASRPAPTPSRTERRSSISAQSTIIGVAAGAILGAATGRSVKSTVIGAAAGGVLGTVVGATTRPGGRGMRS